MSEANLNVAADIGKLILRLTLGVLMLFHGVAKVVNGPAFILDTVAQAGMPEALGYLVFAGEVLALLLIIAGVWTRAAAAVVAINMVVAVALVHMNDIFALSQSGGWLLELQGMYLFTSVAVALLGAGRISLGGTAGHWN